MNKSVSWISSFALALSFVSLAGCGYTTKTNLPENIRTTYVNKVENKIDIAQATNSDKPLPLYRPGLEIEVRNALIERIIFDGHLKIVDTPEKADSLINASLIGFDRDPVRYNFDDSIQEYRIHVTIKVVFLDQSTSQVVWEGEVSGNTEYYLSGQHARSEDEAVAEAIDDLVRHTVENVIEIW